MIELYSVRLLLAAESLTYVLAAWGWWRVWQQPIVERLSAAAAYTVICCLLKVVRIAVELATTTV
jgi:hypothetical protein